MITQFFKFTVYELNGGPGEHKICSFNCDDFFVAWFIGLIYLL